MAKILQFRRDTTAGLNTTSGSLAEIWVDTSKSTIVLMDGNTLGGFPMARESALNALTTSVSTLSSNTWRLATTSTTGQVRPDNSSLVVNSGVLSLGSSIATNWTMAVNGVGSLVFYYSGAAKFSIGSSGIIIASGDITGFGTP